MSARVYNGPMNITEHAKRQAGIRGVDVHEVVSICLERIGRETDGRARSYAVLVGYVDDGFRGFSNGDVVWGIVRGGELRTVMFRRSSQPSTPTALDVERVVA